MKKLCVLIGILFCATSLLGQNKQEVVHLKNGSIVKGTVVGEVTDSIALQTADGSLFIFATSEVAERTKETATSLAHSVNRPSVVQKPMPLQADGGVQYVYIQPEKSPALAGILSYLFPGAGQFYYGNDNLGWTDLTEHVACLVLVEGGRQLYNYTAESNEEAALVGLGMFVVGSVWGVVNQICSIVDAVKGTKAYNRENGYAMYNVGGGVSVGARPQLTYEHPEYALHMPNSLNAGMSFRIAF